MNARIRKRDQWSNLPNELLTTIGEHLDTRIDVLRFQAVCTSWRSSNPHSRNTSPPQFPMKLPYPIVSNPNPVPVRDKRPIYFTLTESTLYRFEPPPTTDQDNTPPNYYSGGWVAKVEEFIPGKFRLLNPLSHHKIRYKPQVLPKKLNLLDYRVSELSKSYKLEYVHANYIVRVAKAIFSADDSAVLVIHGAGKLAFLTLGDENWTQLGEKWDHYTDIMLYKGQFHAVNLWGQVEVIDLVTLKLTKVWKRVFSDGVMLHFVKSSGGLYLVNRLLDRDRRVMYYDENSEEYYYKDKDHHFVDKTVDFKIHKLNETEGDWDKVETFVDQVMFLGDGCSFLSSAEELAGCRGNCIYFTDKNGFYFHSKKDDVLKGLHGHDTALFNLEDRTITGLATGPGNFQVIWPPPTWLKLN